jgi:hypothetical protein
MGHIVLQMLPQLMKMSEEIKVRVDLVTKGELIQIAEIEERDLSDIVRFAIRNLIIERKRRQRQPELSLYAVG